MELYEPEEACSIIMEKGEEDEEDVEETEEK